MDGDGAPDACPNNDQWHVYWYDVELAAGLHAVEFRAREFGGGENSRLRWITPTSLTWADVPADVLSQELYEGALVPLMWGTYDSFGDLLNNATLADLRGEYHHLQLTTSIAGLEAVAEVQALFVPEPASLALLGLGALGLALRRRRK